LETEIAGDEAALEQEKLALLSGRKNYRSCNMLLMNCSSWSGPGKMKKTWQLNACNTSKSGKEA